MTGFTLGSSGVSSKHSVIRAIITALEQNFLKHFFSSKKWNPRSRQKFIKSDGIGLAITIKYVYRMFVKSNTRINRPTSSSSSNLKVFSQRIFVHFGRPVSAKKVFLLNDDDNDESLRPTELDRLESQFCWFSHTLMTTPRIEMDENQSK